MADPITAAGPARGTGSGTSPTPRIVIDRSDLCRELDDCAQGRLTLIVAPAGYGKTVALTQWADRRDDVRWITVGDRERETRPFAARLLDAVHDRLDRDPTSSIDHLDPRAERLGDLFIDALLADMEAAHQPFTIAIDDVDHLGPDVHRDLRSLIARAPSNIRFVATARRDPDLGQSRLRAHGECAEIRIQHLRFDLEETRAVVVRTSGMPLDDEQAAKVMAMTEGWPIAVHLVGLALRSVPDVARCLDEFESNDRNMADLLSEEVLAGLSPQDRDLLIRSSVLPVLDGDLCDQILGVVGSSARLDDLERRGVLLVRLRHNQYRLHRLVREYLRHDLHRIDPGAALSTLEKAATWYRERGDTVAAGDLLVEAKDWDRLRSFVLAEARSAWEAGSFGDIRRWGAALPREYRDARVTITAAVIDIAAGHTEAGEFTLRQLLASELTDGERLAVLAVYTGVADATDDLDGVIAAAREAETLAATCDPGLVPVVVDISEPAALASWARIHAIRAHIFLGRSISSDDVSVTEDDAVGQTALQQVNTLGVRAVHHALDGDLRSARSMAQRAMFIADDQLGSRHPARAQLHVALGLVSVARNDLPAARQSLSEAAEIAEQWRRWSWLRFALIELARIDDLSGQRGSIDLLDRLSTLPAPPPPRWLIDRALLAESNRWLRAGDTSRAALALTPSRSADRSGVVPALVQLAIEAGDSVRAEELIGQWPGAGRFDGLQRRLLVDLVGYQQERPGAVDRLAELAERLEREGNVRLIADNGPRALALLGSALWNRSAFVDRIAPTTSPDTARRPVALLDHLTERELAVLEFLPTRMTNADIATELYVSVNTVRTHVRHIYQKLGVGTRDDAIARAEEHGLLPMTSVIRLLSPAVVDLR